MPICLLEYFLCLSNCSCQAQYTLPKKLNKYLMPHFHPFRLKPTHFCRLLWSILFFTLLPLSQQTANKFQSAWQPYKKCIFLLSFIRNCACASITETDLMTPMPPMHLFCSVVLCNRLCNDRCCFKLRSYIAVNSWKAISVHHVIRKTQQIR